VVSGVRKHCARNGHGPQSRFALRIPVKAAS